MNGIWMTRHGVGLTRYIDIPAFWKYTFSHLNYIKYAVEAMVQNEMNGLTFNCATVGNGFACQIPSDLNSQGQFKEAIVSHYYRNVDYATCLWSLIVILVTFKLFTYVLLKLRYRARKIKVFYDQLQTLVQASRKNP